MIDAGYVYAAGGQLCCGRRSRADIILKPSVLLPRLAAMAEKLRLGRLSGHGQQKGVDALIYRDMITLAQQRSVSDVVLLSGDEDLREGVRTAQDYGVRVVVAGIKAERGNNQSEELVFEADRLWTLDKIHLADVFERRAPDRSSLAPEEVANATEEAKLAAVDFAAEWLRNAAEAEVLELQSNAPQIPKPLDIELLTAVERKIGVNLRDYPDVKRDVRSTWWGVIGGARH